MSTPLLPGCPFRPWLSEPGRGPRYGAESTDRRGRVRVNLYPGHPYAYRAGWAWRSRLILCYRFGRRLDRHEHAHHRNRDRQRDDPRNLRSIPAGEHSRLHAMTKPRGVDGRFRKEQR
jgi:hypothetical protein